MIDFHTHPVLIREFVEKYPNYERAARQVFNIGNNFQPLETFFLQMDVAGIEKAVLLPIDCKRARKDAVSSNEQVAELCAKTKRFIGFASVDPLKKGAARELENAVKKLGLKGLKLDPALQDFRPDARKVYPVYEAAAALGIPLLIHTGMSWAPETPLERGLPLHLERPIRDFPRLNFVLAHFGWPWVWEATALALKYPNVYLDTTMVFIPRRVHVFPEADNPITFIGESALRAFMEQYSDQLLYGSDFPNIPYSYEESINGLLELDLSKSTYQNIFFNTAKKVFKLTVI